MKSFGILRTNVGLTTNVKISVDSKYKMYLNSINSNYLLSSDMYKNYKINYNSLYDEELSKFYKDIPTEIAYQIYERNDSDLMGKDFNIQYDDLYSYGARSIIENKYYDEEFEYFAPLYIDINNIPSNFIIFRVDNSGLDTINRSNFKSQIQNQFKTVRLFDLTNNSNLGKWLDINYRNNEDFPYAPLEIDYRDLEFSKWNGIDYKLGGYVSKSLFTSELFNVEREIFELERKIFDNYRNSEVVFPNILNLSFLFDDRVANLDMDKKWSLNRYYGFYLNSLILEDTMSPFVPNKLKYNTKLKSNNTLVVYDSVNNIELNESPFEDKWSDINPFYIEYDNVFYIVNRHIEYLNDEIQNIDEADYTDEKYQTVVKYVYKISTDIDIYSNLLESGHVPILNEYLDINSFNNNYGFIRTDDRALMSSEYDYFKINNFNEADIWIMNIDGIYHNIIEINELIEFQYEIDNNILIIKLPLDRYEISYNESDYIMNVVYADDTTITITRIDQQIPIFDEINIEIRRIFLQLNTDYAFNFNKSHYNYKIAGEVTNISLIVTKNINPVIFNIYKLDFADIKDFDNRIVDTEYSRYEYELVDEITNTDEPKMYMENILSKSKPRDIDDFRYKDRVVNIPVSSEYTSNYETFKITDGKLSDIWNINPVYCRWGYQGSLSFNDLPYPLNNSSTFETFNKSINPFESRVSRVDRNLDYFYTINSNSPKYEHHSLHIEGYTGGTIDINYTFDTNQYLNGNYDYFNHFFSNSHYFRNGDIKRNYTKYSYLNKGDISLPNDTLFKGIKFNIYNVDSVKLNLLNQIDNINVSSNNEFEGYKFSIIATDTPAEKPNLIYEGCDGNYTIIDGNIWDCNNEEIFKWDIGGYYIVLYYGEFIIQRRQNGSGEIPIWNEHISYNIPNKVYYKGKYYKTLIDNNIGNVPSLDNSTWEIYELASSEIGWTVIGLWTDKLVYNNTSNNRYFVIHNNRIYSTLDTEMGEEPGVSISWRLDLNIYPEEGELHNTDIFYYNGYYYMESGIEYDINCGINIFINKKWKNILIQIYDGILELSNINRDDLYTEFYTSLTGYNFIRSINDLSNKYNFLNYLKYTVIEEDGNYNSYDYQNDLVNLPYLLTINRIDIIDVELDTLKRSPMSDKLYPVRKLDNGNIDELSKINYYNDIPLAYSIVKETHPIIPFTNYSSMSDTSTESIARYSGYYSPIFYTVELFKRGGLQEGNFKFDIELTDFGMMRERKFRKVNREGSILKLRDVDNMISIYPMIDEFGYSYKDFNIFKSTWDKEYFTEHLSNNMIKTRDVTMLNTKQINSSMYGQSLVNKTIDKYNF